MPFTYREAYWDNPNAKQAFISFLKDIHNLDLTRWDTLGCWDNNYRPFSYFDQDQVIASVCLYSMDMTVNGQRTKVAQVSGVGTREAYRGKGLNRELNRKAIDWAKDSHDFFYLFSDTDARPFYQKLGFQPVQESLPKTKINSTEKRNGIRQLSCDNKEELQFIYSMAKKRTSVSDQLGVHNPKLLMFWALYFLRDTIHYIPRLDIIICYKRDNGIVTIFDIIGTTVPPFSDIYPFIADSSDKTVQFRFLPDKLNLPSVAFEPLPDDNGTHILGNFPCINQPFIFPITSMA